MAAFSLNGIHLFDDQFLEFGIKGFIHIETLKWSNSLPQKEGQCDDHTRRR